MAPPKISIVTPSFNQAPYVRAALESVLDQNYPNLEYVVIVGGSTDGSAEIIREYQDRLAYVVSEKDGGHGEALNKGFRRTTGEIMAWLNSDDKYTPWAFETVASIFTEHPDVNWIVGTSGLWNDKGALIGAMRNLKNVHDFLRGDFAWIQQESVFWRRSLWERAGGGINEDFRFMVDGELWTRFFATDDLYHASCLFGGYRTHRDNRAIVHFDKCVEEMRHAIRLMQQKYPNITAGRPDVYRLLTYDIDAYIWKKEVLPREQAR
jgi:glycosyltransferase involved in cell wall biosynthesis